jgi:hypothetical protein
VWTNRWNGCIRRSMGVVGTAGVMTVLFMLRRVGRVR